MTLDSRRKRLLYLSQHRGMKEADILLGNYAAQHLATMSDDELDDFEQLLDEGDNDLVNWILGKDRPPTRLNSTALNRLIETHGQD